MIFGVLGGPAPCAKGRPLISSSDREARIDSTSDGLQNAGSALRDSGSPGPDGLDSPSLLLGACRPKTSLPAVVIQVPAIARVLCRPPLLSLLAVAVGVATPLAGRELVQQGLGAESVVVDASGARPRVSLGAGRVVALETGPSFEPHDLAVAGDAWLVAGSRRGLDRRVRLALIAGGGKRQRELPTPGGQTGALRAMPVVFGGERLLAGESGGGIAWLEGSSSRSFAVWTADWTGDGFDAPVVLSPAAAGTQTGLAGAALHDGTWLLVWSAFDGDDDELMWSLRGDEGWSPPRRVAPDDDRPDITPSVLATDDGALLAWSRFEGGQYRLALASWRDGEWSAPALAGGAGGLYPQFVRGTPHPTLTFLEASRPVVVARHADGARLRWDAEAVPAAGRGSRSVAAASALVPWEIEP
jgi:hypothetical protein